MGTVPCYIAERYTLPRRVFVTREFRRWAARVGLGDRSNIDDRELRALRMLASDLLGLSDDSLERLIASRVLTELDHETKTEGTKHDPGRRPRDRR